MLICLQLVMLTLMLTLHYLCETHVFRANLRQITSGKGVGVQNLKRPNRDIKFSTCTNNW